MAKVKCITSLEIDGEPQADITVTYESGRRRHYTSWLDLPETAQDFYLRSNEVETYYLKCGIEKVYRRRDA